MTPRTQRIAILIFDDYEPLDVWGFVEAFTISRFLGQPFADPPFPFEVVLVAKEKRAIKSSNGPLAMPNYDLAEAASQSFDVLMIPGGLGTRKLVDDKPLLGCGRAREKDRRRLRSRKTVCSGLDPAR
jgi:putative intracellular protease/amidase